MAKKQVPITSVRLLIERGGQILLLRQTTPQYDFWTLPGGKLELHETLEQCARRECKEEIGVRLTRMQLLGVQNFPKLFKHYHRVTFFFQGDIGAQSPCIKEKRSFCQLEWFSRKKLPKNLFAESRQLLKGHYQPTV